jgi:UDP-N-acetylmuramyl pentapeptide phosphotransferase/UDP-N-acetylglucosamine-1-phosphate transferase
MKRIGALLLAVGVLILLFGGFRYSRERTLIDVGPIKAATTEHHQVPISPILGGVAILAGLALLASSRRSLAGKDAF